MDVEAIAEAHRKMTRAKYSVVWMVWATTMLTLYTLPDFVT